MSDKVDADTPTGAKFSGPSRRLALERIWAFSGGPFADEGWPAKNLHTDPSLAKARGLPTIAASGPQYQGYLIGLLVDLFGPRWLRNGSMDIKFVRLVPAGAVITPEAVLRERNKIDNCLVFELDVRCVNADGEPVLVGTATATVADSAASQD